MVEQRHSRAVILLLYRSLGVELLIFLHKIITDARVIYFSCLKFSRLEIASRQYIQPEHCHRYRQRGQKQSIRDRTADNDTKCCVDLQFQFSTAIRAVHRESDAWEDHSCFLLVFVALIIDLT